MKIMKRHFFWIVEVFIWLLILFLVSSGIISAKYIYKKNFNTYQIFLPDVDGLIVGSPVKFMGIQIGYVNQLNIVGEDVYVKFIITEPNIKVPYGSTATVEFSGLGGSKSLELYPPSTDKNYNTKFIIPQSPKRIGDSFGLLNDMFDKFIEITYDVSHFMDKVGIIKIHGLSQKNKIKLTEQIQQIKQIKQNKPPKDFLETSNCWLDKVTKQCDKFNDKITSWKEGKNGQSNGQNK